MITSFRLNIIAALLLVVFAGQAVFSMQQKSVTVDELVYIAAGYYNLKTGKFDFNNTNPPLFKILSALPLLALDLELPEMNGDPTDWSEVEQWQYARSFMYDNRTDADIILFVSRLPTVALGLVLGFVLFYWARLLYGPGSALLALFLYSFSPNLLAHVRLATQDFGLTAFVFITVFLFWRFLCKPSIGRLLITALLFSAAILTKTSALFIVPAALIVFVILLLRYPGQGSWIGLPGLNRIPEKYIRTRQAVSLLVSFALIGLVALAGMNAGYLFEGSLMPLSEYIAPERVANKLGVQDGMLHTVINHVLSLPTLVPEPFVNMVSFQSARLNSGSNIYFAGEVSRQGWWYVMPVSFLIKTPLPFLLLLSGSIYLMIRRRECNTAELLSIVTCLVFFVLFTYLKKSNVGLRYILPIFPFLQLLASRIIKDRVWLLYRVKFAVAALAVWYLLGTIRIYPDYLAYFNETVGGPDRGYLYLADSYLDWGQDLKGLKRYMKEHDIPKIRLAYFGSADANYYGIDYEYLPSVGLAPREPGQRWWYDVKTEDLPPLEVSPGPVAISASLLAGIFYNGYYKPFRELEPVDQVGHSILIYEP